MTMTMAMMMTVVMMVIDVGCWLILDMLPIILKKKYCKRQQQLQNVSSDFTNKSKEFVSSK